MENIPEERPTAEQLLRILEGLKGDIEGPCGELTIMDAARQVKTAIALKERSKQGVDDLSAKEEEIQQLQQQLEVLATSSSTASISFIIINLCRQLMHSMKRSYVKKMLK